MTIPINVEKKKFFEVYLTCLHPVLKLKEREIEVASIILLLHFNNYGKMEENKLGDFLLSADMRKKIRNYLEPKMSEANFNNHIFQLRKKKILIGNNVNPSIVDKYPKGSSKKIVLTYDINFVD